jgi:WD40 repeat protein
VASGSVVKIYHPRSVERLSCLPVPDTSSRQDKTVTALLLLPSNDTHLLVASMDGFLRIWDILSATITHEVDMGVPITGLAMHAGDHKHVYLSTTGHQNAKEASSSPLLL